MGSDGLTDHRWEGYGDDELADVVDQLTTGRGAESMAGAADTLDGVTDSLRQIDATLYEQLGAIGVHWQSSQASGLAANAMGASRDYNDGAMGQVMVSARSVGDQGGAYEAGKHGMPETSALRARPEAAAPGAAITGNVPDHTQQVRARNEARHQAIDGLNNYGQSSRRNLAAHQPLPPSPPVNVRAPEAPVAGSSTAPASHVPPPATSPAGPGLPEGGLAPGPVVGSPGSAPPAGTPGPPAATPGPPAGTPGPVPNPGIAAGSQGVPGGPAFGAIAGPPGTVGGGPNPGGPGAPGPGAPGGGAPGGGGPGAGGKVMGVGPLAPGTPAAGAGGAAAPGAVPRGFPNATGSAALGAAAIAGGAGAAAGANGDQERLSRSGRVPSTRTGTVGGLPDEQAAASRTASRVGSTAEQRRSMLQPATGHADDEEDDEHVRRYGVDAEDLFTDQRMVAMPVLGDHGHTEDPAK